jgi:RNase P subunit RPR2
MDLNKRNFIRQWVLIFSLLWAGAGFAEPLYLSQMKSAQVDVDKSEEVIKQLKEYRPIELAPPLKLAPFHNQVALQDELKRDFCVSCHTAMPHRKSERLRSYLNMHVNHLACASCHFKPQGVALKYRWHQWDSKTKEASAPLITPHYQGQPVTPDADNPEIAKLLETWDESDISEQAEQHQRLHNPLEREGTRCDSCHTTEASLLDFEQLDYDEEEIHAIRNDRIARFLGDEVYEDKPIKLMDLLQ